MAEAELVRVDIGFRSGDVLSVRIPAGDASGLDAALRENKLLVCELDAEDARVLVVLEHVLYVKRYAREAKVGFT
jgi:hypothetical protein